MEDDAKPVTLTLTEDVALVFSDWLDGVVREGRDLYIADHAEQVAIWSVVARFEPLIDEIVDPRYREFVDAARKRRRGEE